MARAPILPDVLPPGLHLVFCGTAAGRRSAEDGAYYAHPGNLFWRTLHEVGLTPYRLAPGEYPRLPEWGIGLTDLAKFHSGNDDQLPGGAFDAGGLRERILAARPAVVAFTSKNAARAALGGRIDYGWQPQTIGATRLFALPSPSGQARGHWNRDWWQRLADAVRAETTGIRS